MTNREDIPKLFKLTRSKIDDELWKKLMKLFVHGEELMAMEIFCEELVEHEVSLNDQEKSLLKNIASYIELDLEEYPRLF